MYAQFGLKGHNGIDYRTHFDGKKDEQEVHAAMDGTVINVANEGTKGYGRYIRLQHIGNEQTIYAHLSRQDVKIGQKIKAGQVIGRTGNTGFSTGPHLHFGWRQKGWDKNYNNGYAGYADPLPYLRAIDSVSAQQEQNNNQSNTIIMNENMRKFLQEKTGVDFGSTLSEAEQNNVVRLLGEREAAATAAKSATEKQLRDEVSKTWAVVEEKDRMIARYTQERNDARKEIERMTVAHKDSHDALTRELMQRTQELSECRTQQDDDIDVDEIVGIIKTKDWKRAGWLLADIGLAVVATAGGAVAVLDQQTLDQLRDAVTTHTVSAGLVIALLTVVAQYATKKLNMKQYVHR